MERHPGRAYFSPLLLTDSPQISPAMTVTLLMMPVLFFGLVSFWMPYSPFYHPVLARFIDARMGAHALEGFLVRLKPLLMFAMAAVIQGLAGVWHNYRTGAPPGAFAIPGFILSGGVGFALVHLVLYLRRVGGVYPLPTTSDATVDLRRAAPRRTSLRDALRTDWWTLIGIAIFPTVAVVGSELCNLPFEFLAILFFAVGLLATWPHVSGRAPYSFWLVAVGVWLLGGILAIVLLELLRVLGLIR